MSWTARFPKGTLAAAIKTMTLKTLQKFSLVKISGKSTIQCVVVLYAGVHYIHFLFIRNTDSNKNKDKFRTRQASKHQNAMRQ